MRNKPKKRPSSFITQVFSGNNGENNNLLPDNPFLGDDWHGHNQPPPEDDTGSQPPYLPDNPFLGPGGWQEEHNQPPEETGQDGPCPEGYQQQPNPFGAPFCSPIDPGPGEEEEPEVPSPFNRVRPGSDNQANEETGFGRRMANRLRRARLRRRG